MNLKKERKHFEVFFVLPKEYQLIDIDKIMELENHIKVIITVKLIPLKILKGAKTSGHN